MWAIHLPNMKLGCYNQTFELNGISKDLHH
jgi:hypothetical protein